jgi:hypothetical protein
MLIRPQIFSLANGRAIRIASGASRLNGVTIGGVRLSCVAMSCSSVGQGNILRGLARVVLLLFDLRAPTRRSKASRATLLYVCGCVTPVGCRHVTVGTPARVSRVAPGWRRNPSSPETVRVRPSGRTRLIAETRRILHIALLHCSMAYRNPPSHDDVIYKPTR